MKVKLIKNYVVFWPVVFLQFFLEAHSNYFLQLPDSSFSTAWSDPQAPAITFINLNVQNVVCLHFFRQRARLSDITVFRPYVEVVLSSSSVYSAVFIVGVV